MSLQSGMSIPTTAPNLNMKMKCLWHIKGEGQFKCKWKSPSLLIKLWSTESVHWRKDILIQGMQEVTGCKSISTWRTTKDFLLFWAELNVSSWHHREIVKYNKGLKTLRFNIGYSEVPHLPNELSKSLTSSRLRYYAREGNLILSFLCNLK